MIQYFIEFSKATYLYYNILYCILLCIQAQTESGNGPYMLADVSDDQIWRENQIVVDLCILFNWWKLTSF